MEITWYGLGCFRIAERGYPAVITDPFDEDKTGYTLPRVRAEIVSLSTPLEDATKVRWRGFRGVQRTLASPGEYEIGGLFVTGVSSYRDTKKGTLRGENIIYTFEVNGFSVCHLGELGHVLNQSRIEAIGNVNVLLIPVGLEEGLTPSMASEVVSLIEPNIVIPTNYQTPGLKIKRKSANRFLKEMGITSAPTEAVLKLTSGNIPEATTVIVLEPQIKKEKL